MTSNLINHTISNASIFIGSSENIGIKRIKITNSTPKSLSINTFCDSNFLIFSLNFDQVAKFKNLKL